jgi:hypothetical protein
MNKNDAAWKAKFPEIRAGFNAVSPRGIGSDLSNDQTVFHHLDKNTTTPDRKM